MGDAMDGRWRRWVGYTVVALAVGLAGSAVAGIVVGVREAARQHYWEAGFVRLCVDAIWDGFDRALPFALPAGAVVVALARAVRWRRGPFGRAPVRAATVAVVAIALLRAATLVDAWRAARGPNVLLISIDTLRADHLGTYGSALETSPTIDRRLAAEGVTFEDVYSQSPKTTPSHMTMLTSLYPCVHGIELWAPDAPGHVLNPAVHTLAEVLKNAGYATAAFTGGVHVHRTRGFDQGFDRYKHSRQLERTFDWLGRPHLGKWFVFFHTYEVHDPYLPPPELVARFDGDYRGPILDAVTRLRANGGGWERAHAVFWGSVDKSDPRAVRFVARLYDAGIRGMDEHTVAPLLDRLDALDVARDTLVVFTADHGEAFGEHGRFEHDDVYAGTVHVPLVIRFPGRVPAGRRVPGPGRVLDVMPTILDLLGIRAPDGIQGTSLRPLIMRTDAPPRESLSEYQPGRLLTLRRDGVTYLAEGPVDRLFDRHADPGEEHDLAVTRPDAVAAARAEVARWREDCGRLRRRFGPGDETVVPDAETTRQLRALGYID